MSEFRIMAAAVPAVMSEEQQLHVPELSRSMSLDNAYAAVYGLKTREETNSSGSAAAGGSGVAGRWGGWAKGMRKVRDRSHLPFSPSNSISGGGSGSSQRQHFSNSSPHAAGSSSGAVNMSAADGRAAAAVAAAGAGGHRAFSRANSAPHKVMDQGDFPLPLGLMPEESVREQRAVLGRSQTMDADELSSAVHLNRQLANVARSGGGGPRELKRTLSPAPKYPHSNSAKSPDCAAADGSTQMMGNPWLKARSTTINSMPHLSPHHSPARRMGAAGGALGINFNPQFCAEGEVGERWGMSGPASSSSLSSSSGFPSSLQSPSPLHSSPLHSSPLHSSPLHPSHVHSSPIHSSQLYPPPFPSSSSLPSSRLQLSPSGSLTTNSTAHLRSLSDEGSASPSMRSAPEERRCLNLQNIPEANVPYLHRQQSLDSRIMMASHPPLAPASDLKKSNLFNRRLLARRHSMDPRKSKLQDAEVLERPFGDLSWD